MDGTRRSPFLQKPCWPQHTLNGVVFVRNVPSFFAHHDAASLLELHVKDEQVRSKAKVLTKILSNKNLVAYEDREFTESEAGDLAKITQRFFDWSQSLLI